MTSTLVEQLEAPNAMLQPTEGCGSEVDVLSLPVAVTVMDAEGLVLVLWAESPPYPALMGPEQGEVPGNLTEQPPPPDVEDKEQLVQLREPPGRPGGNETG